MYYFVDFDSVCMSYIVNKVNIENTINIVNTEYLTCYYACDGAECIVYGFIAKFVYLAISQCFIVCASFDPFYCLLLCLYCSFLPVSPLFSLEMKLSCIETADEAEEYLRGLSDECSNIDQRMHELSLCSSDLDVLFAQLNVLKCVFSSVLKAEAV